LGSSLNGHVHFHVCAVDGVFEEVAGIVFHPASAIDEAAVAQVQTDLRRRIRGFWTTSGLTPSPRTSSRRAGHRCGMTAMRR
jgi:hypothetical protein